MMSDFFESFLTPPATLNPIFTFYNPKILDPPPPLKSDIIYERSLVVLNGDSTSSRKWFLTTLGLAKQ